MMILVPKSPPALLKHWQPNLGILTSPRRRTELDEWGQHGGVWAAAPRQGLIF